jgi:pyrroloquinoline-quinone synthase
MENRIETVGLCDAAIARHELLNHPFYQSWSAGTLPIAALRDYAREYGAFIATIDSGWRTLGEDEIARHEIGHARVWDRTFAAALQTAVEAPRTAEVGALLETARECFAGETSAIGALYAFEAQQPATAKSKLLGLKAHYAALPTATGEYFELHSGDYDEKTLLVERMAQLDEVGSAEVVAACERMSHALYDALSGIHGPYAGHCAA